MGCNDVTGKIVNVKHIRGVIINAEKSVGRIMNVKHQRGKIVDYCVVTVNDGFAYDLNFDL